MEVKKHHEDVGKLQRWEIDWNAINYKWTNELIGRMKALALQMKSPRDEQNTIFDLDIDGVNHKVKIYVEEGHGLDELVFTFYFLNRFPLDDPHSGKCMIYKYHSSGEYSELINLAYMLPEGKDTGYTISDCPGSLTGMPYGDYIMRIVDQMNVALGVRFCTLENSFYFNKPHLLRFRCTYYNKFGYYGQGIDMHKPGSRYAESNVLTDVDRYNRALKMFAFRDVDGTMDHADEMIKMYADEGYKYHIKPYGENLVRFIPSETIGDNIIPARFEVYPNPKGSSRLINRLADAIGSIFVSFAPPKPISVYVGERSDILDDIFPPAGRQVPRTKLCDVCGTENAFDAQECVYCGVGFEA